MKDPKIIDLLCQIDNLQNKNNGLTQTKYSLLEQYKKDRKSLNQELCKNHREITHKNNQINVYLKQQNST